MAEVQKSNTILTKGTNELCQDILIDIFTRLPLKSLFVFRCVSKFLRKLIDDPDFAVKHMRLAKEEPMILQIDHIKQKAHTLCLNFVRKNQNQDPVLKFDLKLPVGSSGYCNGLVYFVEEDRGPLVGDVVVANPLRRECYRLPPIEIPHLKTYGLGFDDSTNIFKMVCVSYHGVDCGSSRYKLSTMIHDLGTSSWREICGVPRYPISNIPVFASGFLYWLVYPSLSEDHGNNKIVSFHVRKEEFGLVTGPEVRLQDYQEISLTRLVNLNGDLVVVDIFDRARIKIWVMKDRVNNRWMKYCCISLVVPSKRSGRFEVMGLWKGGQILLKSIDGFFIYSLKTKSCSRAFLAPKPL